MKQESPGSKKVPAADDSLKGNDKASPKAVDNGMQDPGSPLAEGQQRGGRLSALQHSHSIFDGATVTWGKDDV